MAQKRGNIFNRIKMKDYTLELEKILDYKHFSETSKNYLLSMMYKIENSYDDYKMVKRYVQSKENFIEDILYILQKKCTKINIIKLKDLASIDEEDKLSVDIEKGIINVIPNEEYLLEGIMMLSDVKWQYSTRNKLIEKPINNMLNIGKNLNVVEEIRNFDGWSWNNNVGTEDEKMLFQHIIYNNLMLIYGRELIENWLYSEMSCDNYLKKLRNLLDRESDKEEIKEFFDVLLATVTLLNMNDENKQEYIETFLEQEKINNELKNKRKYMMNVNAIKREYLNKVKNIDIILKNPELLKKEYVKTNKKLPNKEKIFSVKIYAQHLNEEKQGYVEEIRKCNEMVSENNILELRMQTKAEFDLLKRLDLFTEGSRALEKNFIKFERKLLKLILEKLKKIEDNEELINLIYLFRYYKMMPLNQNSRIKDISTIKAQISEIEKLIVLKAINNKLLTGIGNIVDANIEIYRKALFDTKIINLENIIIEPVKQENKIKFNIYDGSIIEDHIILDIDNYKKAKIKLKKKINAFE